MRRYGLSTKREAVNMALRRVAGRPMTLEEARAMRGTGWEGDLEEMRRMSPQLEAWINRPEDEGLPGLEKYLSSRSDSEEAKGQQTP